MAILAAIASGVVLAACTGLRAFLPLFAAGVASRALSWELAPSMQWLASDPALITLGVASLAEVIADKVPVVDHALDAVHTVVAPVAGALAGLSVWLNFPAPIAVALAVLVGAPLAGGVHLVAAGTRLKSTAVSAGTLNPAVSVAEDVATLSGIVLAVLAPLVALIVLVVGLTLLVRRRRRRRAADATR
jgi:hypothetical protein